MPTLEEELLRKATSIGAAPIEVSGRALVPPSVVMGAGGVASALDRGGVRLLTDTARHLRDMIGDQLLRYGLKTARDHVERETGAHLPRTIPEAWNLLMNRDDQLVNARPPEGSYPIAYNKTP